MFATAPATARPARSSRGREMMRTTRPPVVDGLSLALQAASSDTSTSTTARIQASYAIVTDFFNGLLVVAYSRNLLGMRTRTPGPLPGVAQPAIQEGRSFAVADLRFLRFSGFPAWLVW